MPKRDGNPVHVQTEPLTVASEMAEQLYADIRAAIHLKNVPELKEQYLDNARNKLLTIYKMITPEKRS